MEKSAILAKLADRIEASPHNLVSARARAELRIRHLPECQAFAELLPKGSYRLLDLGSGGGLPGLVVAVVRPELDTHLLEATGKKAQFLRETADALGIAAVVHHGRAESLARTELGGSFDVVTARAVAPLVRLVGLAYPFLRPGGALHAIKGQRWPEELAEALPVLARLRAQVLSTPEDQAGRGQSPAPVVGNSPVPAVVVVGRPT